MKLVESDVPDSILDSSFTPLVAKKRREGGVHKMYFGDEAHGWTEGRTDLLNLAVLTFPRIDVPRFKVTRMHDAASSFG